MYAYCKNNDTWIGAMTIKEVFEMGKDDDEKAYIIFQCPECDEKHTSDLIMKYSVGVGKSESNL